MAPLFCFIFLSFQIEDGMINEYIFNKKGKK